jgi:transglutaminase-like putative cysteine protease
MLLTIAHETIYRYAQAAAYSIQVVRLYPRSDGGQRIIAWQIDSPGRRWQQLDACGNQIYALSRNEPHSETRIVARGQVETASERGLLVPHGIKVPPLAFAQPTRLTESDAAIADLAAQTLGGGAPASRDGLDALMAAIFGRVAYVQGVTEVHHTAAETLAAGSGVCQDMTHIFVAACRAAGVPARYVSGYILTDDRHAASHAWAEAWIAGALGGAGAWLGYDVTHNRLAGPELCRLAVGRDYLDAGPVRGSRIGGSQERMEVKVTVADSMQALVQQQ